MYSICRYFFVLLIIAIFGGFFFSFRHNIFINYLELPLFELPFSMYILMKR